MRRLLATTLVLLVSAGAGTAHAAGPAAPVAIGAFIGSSYRDPGLYDSWAREVGRRPVVLGSYKSWNIPLIDVGQLDAIWTRDAVPTITWEPWDEGSRDYSLSDIAAGVYDDYIRRSAEQAAAWGHPLFIRFAHEMNGAWYPWGRGSSGNSPALYKEAWRRIVRIFEASGATNVRWIWCPNENSSGRFAFKQYYPGDRWVDWVGLDGFNWQQSPGWQSFDEIFAASYNSLVELTEKPVMIVETGSWETGGSKAAWVSDLLTRELPEYGHIRAFLWWSVDDPRGDLRVDSSPAALAALRSGLASPRYDATREDVIETPERLGPATPVPVPGASGLSLGRVRKHLQNDYVWIGLAALAASLLVLAIVLVVARRRHRGAVPVRRTRPTRRALATSRRGPPRLLTTRSSERARTALGRVRRPEPSPGPRRRRRQASPPPLR